MMESHTARDSLELIAAARSAAADRLITPWWYHPVLGLLAAQLVLGYALGGAVVRIACLVVYLLGIALLVRAYRAMTGMWISGLRPGRARRSAIAIGVLFAACMIAAIVLGRRFDDVLRTELRAGR